MGPSVGRYPFVRAHVGDSGFSLAAFSSLGVSMGCRAAFKAWPSPWKSSPVAGTTLKAYAFLFLVVYAPVPEEVRRILLWKAPCSSWRQKRRSSAESSSFESSSENLLSWLGRFEVSFPAGQRGPRSDAANSASSEKRMEGGCGEIRPVSEKLWRKSAQRIDAIVFLLSSW